jgi:LysR family glycine cleavage system transcriptional activator
VHVTPGAISHQVRALEEDLGLQLFHRHGKRISITETGERFAATIRKALGEIAQAADHLRSLTRQQRLVISATPSFASRWLAPRLWKFIDAHPEIEVVLQSGSHLADLRLDGVDIGIRFGRGQYAGVVTEKLSDDYYYPVAAPGYRGKQNKKLARPADLVHCTLLRMDTRESWQPWLTLAGLDLPEPRGTLVVEDSSLTLRHAVEGKGWRCHATRLPGRRSPAARWCGCSTWRSCARRHTTWCTCRRGWRSPAWRPSGNGSWKRCGNSRRSRNGRARCRKRQPAKVRP